MSVDKCNKHDIEITLDSRLRRRPCRFQVNWIFRKEEDELQFNKASEKEKSVDKKPKIFVVLDFPQVIKSAMGPNRGWDGQADKRRKNLKSFFNTMNSLLKLPKYSKYKNDVVFLKFDKKKMHLSNYIRYILARDNQNDFILVSDSYCDGEK